MSKKASRRRPGTGLSGLDSARRYSPPRVRRMPTGYRLQPGRSVHRAQISGLNHRGEGVGRILSGPEEGMAVFIPGTVPGDIVEFALLERKKNYMRGRSFQSWTRVREGRSRSAPVAHPCGLLVAAHHLSPAT